jgi:hypothetical protein
MPILCLVIFVCMIPIVFLCCCGGKSSIRIPTIVLLPARPFGTLPNNPTSLQVQEMLNFTNMNSNYTTADTSNDNNNNKDIYNQPPPSYNEVVKSDLAKRIE